MWLFKLKTFFNVAVFIGRGKDAQGSHWRRRGGFGAGMLSGVRAAQEGTRCAGRVRTLPSYSCPGSLPSPSAAGPTRARGTEPSGCGGGPPPWPCTGRRQLTAFLHADRDFTRLSTKLRSSQVQEGPPRTPRPVAGGGWRESALRPTGRRRRPRAAPSRARGWDTGPPAAQPGLAQRPRGPGAPGERASHPGVGRGGRRGRGRGWPAVPQRGTLSSCRPARRPQRLPCQFGWPQEANPTAHDICMTFFL